MGKSAKDAVIRRLAKAMGDHEYGYCDEIDTPNNWGRAFALAQVAVEELENIARDELIILVERRHG